MSAAKVDEDDPVVRELPVYLSLELASQLYLLQYPLRSADRPYSDDGGGPPVSAIFNPFKAPARCRTGPQPCGQEGGWPWASGKGCA
jgi:hypothetical protein